MLRTTPCRLPSLSAPRTRLNQRARLPAQSRAADHASEQHLRLHVEQIPLAIIEWNTDFEVMAWNPAAERVFGYTAAEAVGKHARDLMILAERMPSIEADVWPALITQPDGSKHFTNQNRTKSGAIIWCEWYDTPLVDARGAVVGVASVALDITRQKTVEKEREAALSALTQREERFRIMTENSSDKIGILDENMVMLYQSEAVEHILGYKPSELVGMASQNYIHPDDLSAVGAYFAGILATPNQAGEPVLYRFRHKKNGWCWLESIAINLLEHPGVGGVLVNSRDVTERIEAEEKLRWQTRHDALTSLPNRAHFMEQVEVAINSARRRKQKAALFFVDLNRFKSVNDSMGHAAGDTLLQEVARRLQTVLPPGGIAARLSGDEFALLVPLTRDRDAAQTARRVLHVLSSRPALVNGNEIRVGASVGVAVFPHDGASGETLLKAADTAMYRAKEHPSYGRDRRDRRRSPVPDFSAVPHETVSDPAAGTYQLFTPQMSEGEAEAQAFETALRHAVRGNGEFCLVYQPIVSCENKQWHGVEALLRWRHPQLGLLGPDKFLQQVREGGLMDLLNGWVLREACRTASLWRASGVALPVWVNMGFTQTQQAFGENVPLLEQVKAALAEFHLSPDAIIVEITPVMAADVAAAGMLRALHAFGVGAALDDFGTGYSSLAALRQFPLTALKIDRALLQNIAASPKEAAFVRATVAMAHALQFRVVAEGVENAAQADLLREMDCDLMQGYHIRRPLSAQNLTEDASYSALHSRQIQTELPAGFYPPGPSFRLALAEYKASYTHGSSAAALRRSAPRE